MEATGGMSAAEIAPVKAWFAVYVDWMATCKNGIEEDLAANNHGACWVLRVAEFAQFAGRKHLVNLCRNRYKHHPIPDQVAKAGTSPLELARTKPYSYSLFDGDVLTGICQSLSTPKENLWAFKGPNGAGVAEVMAFQYPIVADKFKRPHAKDVEYFDDFPSRRSSLLFAGQALAHPESINAWKETRRQPDRSRGRSQPANSATAALGRPGTSVVAIARLFAGVRGLQIAVSNLGLRLIATRRQRQLVLCDGGVAIMEKVEHLAGVQLRTLAQPVGADRLSRCF